MSLSQERIAELNELCRQERIDVIKAIHKAQSGHPGGSFSVMEILTVLYQERMNVTPENCDSPERDRLVLCKGHAVPALYSNLIAKGILPAGSLSTLRAFGSPLRGHPALHTRGIDMSSGPLGTGLPAAQGIALGLRMDGIPARVYAILGDGELNEGTVWEAAQSIPKFKLANLTAVVDHNGVQLDGTTDEIMPLHDVGEKFRAFGWNVLHCDGHDVNDLNNAFEAAAAYTEGPTVIVASTVKGKGVSFMENQNTWHGKVPNDEELAAALKELGGEQ
jgi:transketolase